MTCKNTHAGPFRELHVRVTSGPQLRGRGHALPVVPAPPPAPPRLGGPSPPTRSRRQATAGHLYLTLILREGTLRRVCLPRRRSREAQRGALEAHGVVARQMQPPRASLGYVLASPRQHLGVARLRRVEACVRLFRTPPGRVRSGRTVACSAAARARPGPPHPRRSRPGRSVAFQSFRRCAVLAHGFRLRFPGD